jgi:hypothetical protein
LFVLQAGHFDYADKEHQMRQLNQEVARFFIES